MKALRRILAPIFLSLLLTTVTTGHVSEPIKPIPQEFFVPVVIGLVIVDSFTKPVPTNKPTIEQPEAQAKVLEKRTPKPQNSGGFVLDSNVSWYGPNFYGNRTACGHAYTKTILGVAHKTLPCGTLVTFKHNGRQLTVPVIDRGPYAAGRQWDLSGGLCIALNHCFTGQIYYRIE